MNHAFILALGRSGTQFLARMLRHDSNAAVYHEPYLLDASIMNLRYGGFHQVANAMMHERFQTMTLQSKGKSIHLETNSYLRYEADWLRKNLDASLVRIVRDGRSYVRSAYVRDVYTASDIQQAIVPHDDDPYATTWGEMNRFEKICWYWQHSNRMLAKDIPEGVHMEDLLKDYTVFHDKILTPLGMHISEEHWKNEVSRPANTGTRYRIRRQLRGWLGRAPRTNRPTPLPPPKEWPQDLNKSFTRICGTAMEEMGYSV